MAEPGSWTVCLMTGDAGAQGLLLQKVALCDESGNVGSEPPVP